jgi:hypothetical protein
LTKILVLTGPRISRGVEDDLTVVLDLVTAAEPITSARSITGGERLGSGTAIS